MVDNRCSGGLVKEAPVPGVPAIDFSHTLAAVAGCLILNWIDYRQAKAIRQLREKLNQSALPHLKRYPTKVVASTKMLPKKRRQPRGWRHKQDGKARIVGHAERSVPDLFQE